MKAAQVRLLAAMILATVLWAQPAASATERPRASGPDTGNSSITWSETSRWDVGTSRLEIAGAGTGGRELSAVCRSATDPSCRQFTVKDTTYYPTASVILVPCATPDDVGCIEEVSVGADDNALSAAAFVSHLATDDPELQENRAMRLPRGHTAGLWRTSAGDTYLVSAAVRGTVRSTKKGSRSTPATFEPDRMRLVVNRASVTDLAPGTTLPEFRKAWSKKYVNPNGSAQILNQAGTCTPTQCFNETEFGPVTRIRMVVRIPDGLETWLNGRIDGAVIRSERLTSARTRLTVEGDALATHHAGGSLPTASIPADLHRKYWCPEPSAPCAANRSVSYLDSPEGLTSFLDLEPYFGARSTLTRARWDVGNTWASITGFDEEGNGVSPDCLRLDTGLVGIVGTNAAVFEASPPKWNPVTGRLDFRIASPHLAADGNIAVGRYTLALPPVVAQCMYGRSALPPTVEVSVAEDNGTTRTETVTVSNDGNWVRFAVSGFTFSAPRITVKLGVGTSVKVGGTLGVSALRSAAGLPGNARPRVSVTASSAKICRVRGTSVSALKKGVCVVKVRNGSATQTLAVLVRSAKAGSGQSVRGARY